MNFNYKGEQLIYSINVALNNYPEITSGKSQNNYMDSTCHSIVLGFDGQKNRLLNVNRVREKVELDYNYKWHGGACHFKRRPIQCVQS